VPKPVSQAKEKAQRAYLAALESGGEAPLAVPAEPYELPPAMTEAEIVSLEALAEEIHLTSAELGDIVMVRRYGPDPTRAEITFRDLAALRTIVQVLPGARVIGLKRPPLRPGDEHPQAERGYTPSKPFLLHAYQELERTPDGDINNCALANLGDESECQMCPAACPDRERFVKLGRWLGSKTAAVGVVATAAASLIEIDKLLLRIVDGEPGLSLNHLCIEMNVAGHYGSNAVYASLDRILAGGLIFRDDVGGIRRRVTNGHDGGVEGLQVCTWCGEIAVPFSGGACGECGV